MRRTHNGAVASNSSYSLLATDESDDLENPVAAPRVGSGTDQEDLAAQSLFKFMNNGISEVAIADHASQDARVASGPATRSWTYFSSYFTSSIIYLRESSCGKIVKTVGDAAFKVALGATSLVAMVGNSVPYANTAPKAAYKIAANLPVKIPGVVVSGFSYLLTFGAVYENGVQAIVCTLGPLLDLERFLTRSSAERYLRAAPDQTWFDNVKMVGREFVKAGFYVAPALAVGYQLSLPTDEQGNVKEDITALQRGLAILAFFVSLGIFYIGVNGLIEFSSDKLRTVMDYLIKKGWPGFRATEDDHIRRATNAHKELLIDEVRQMVARFNAMNPTQRSAVINLYQSMVKANFNLRNQELQGVKQAAERELVDAGQGLNQQRVTQYQAFKDTLPPLISDDLPTQSTLATWGYRALDVATLGMLIINVGSLPGYILLNGVGGVGLKHAWGLPGPDLAYTLIFDLFGGVAMVGLSVKATLTVMKGVFNPGPYKSAADLSHPHLLKVANAVNLFAAMFSGGTGALVNMGFFNSNGKPTVGTWFMSGAGYVGADFTNFYFGRDANEFILGATMLASMDKKSLIALKHFEAHLIELIKNIHPRKYLMLCQAFGNGNYPEEVKQFWNELSQKSYSELPEEGLPRGYSVSKILEDSHYNPMFLRGRRQRAVEMLEYTGSDNAANLERRGLLAAEEGEGQQQHAPV